MKIHTVYAAFRQDDDYLAIDSISRDKSQVRAWLQNNKGINGTWRAQRVALVYSTSHDEKGSGPWKKYVSNWRKANPL